MNCFSWLEFQILNNKEEVRYLLSSRNNKIKAWIIILDKINERISVGEWYSLLGKDISFQAIHTFSRDGN